MFSTFGQPKEFKQLYQYSKGLKDISNKMLERAKASSSFGRSLLLLMRLEAPKYAIYFEPIMKEYERLSISYATCAKIQRFAFEDLNDIIVRFPVVQRKEHEKVKLIQAYNSSNKKYKEAKLNFKKLSTQENQMILTKTRDERARIAGLVIEKSDECISYQARFDKFVQNRSTTSWKRFSLSIAKLYHEETEIMENLAGYCSNFKKNIDDPDKILQFSISKIEKANQALKVNNSAPTIEPSPIHLTKKQEVKEPNEIKLESNLSLANNDEISNEEFKRLTESMQLDFKGSFDIDGIDFSNSDKSDDSNNSIGDELPADLNISNLNDDELIKNLLESK